MGQLFRIYIHYDGDLKIRRKSKIKQIKKHETELGKVIKRLDDHTADQLIKIQSSILFSFKNKLSSMAIGKVDIENYKNTGTKMCWGDGFKLIENNKYIRRQLRELDHSRDITIYELKKYLKKRNIPDIEKDEEDKPFIKENFSRVSSFFL